MLEITVSDPVRHGDGMNAYVTYKVTTKTDLDRFDSGHFYVHRRYSDFAWLQEQLSQSFPGVIIPPLPEKQVMRRFSEPFLSQRQRSLEKFLCRIASHESLRESPFVKAFLELENLESTKEAKGGKKKKSLWQWAADATSSLSTKVTGGPQVDRPRTDEDVKFDEIKQYVNSLEPQINAVSKHTHSLVEKNKDLAQSLFDFGLAFTLLGQAEQDALGEAMSLLGQCADKLSRITSVEADKEGQFLDEPIKDYVRLVRQVKAALDVRSEKVSEYEAALAQLEARKTTREKLNAQTGLDPSTRAERVAAAEEEMRKAERNVERTEEECSATTKRVFAEMERFKREKLIDFKSIVLDYVQLQIEYNQLVEEAWRECLPALQALNVHQQPNSQPQDAPAASTVTADEESTTDDVDQGLAQAGDVVEENDVVVNEDVEEEQTFV